MEKRENMAFNSNTHKIEQSNNLYFRGRQVQILNLLNANLNS